MRDRAHKVMMPKELAERRQPGEAPAGKGIIIKDAEQVVTLSPSKGRPLVGSEMRELGIYENCSVLIENGRIGGVGKYDEHLSGRSHQDFELINAAGKTVMPGFVDSHTHLVFAGTRAFELAWKVDGASYREIAERGGGIQRTVQETRAASEAALHEQAEVRLSEMLSLGTTTVEAKSGYGLRTMDEVKMLIVARLLDERHPAEVVSTFLGAHAFPERYKDDREGYVELIVDEMIPTVADRGLAEFCDVFCEEGYFTPEESKRILEKGQTHGMKSKVHADEFSSSGGARIAAEVGAITADHLLQTTDEDMELMAKSGVVAVLLPAVPLLSMEERFADARKMIGMDIPVAIATDLNPNCWVTSMQTVISLACYKMRMSPEEAIAAATINAAHAIGRGDRIGSLDEGKQADVLILDLPDYTHIPYTFDRNCVETVIKKGEVVHTRA